MEIYPEDSRLTTYPIRRQSLWQLYKGAQRCYWTVEEVVLSVDAAHYANKLNSHEQLALRQVLGFFASIDGLVNVNIAARFKQEIPILEAGYFYDFQIMMENIHAEMYSILIDAIIPDERVRRELFASTKTMPVIGAISEFIIKCVESEEPLQERLFRMACVEGVLFVGCFCYIYWLQQRALMPGLALSNEFISRDEQLHAMFALTLVRIITEHPLPPSVTSPIPRTRVVAIMTEMMGLVDALTASMFPVSSLPGMNAALMSTYVRFVADNLLAVIDEPPMYRVQNPFPFMEQINLRNRTDFFHRPVSEYAKQATAETSEYATVDDF